MKRLVRGIGALLVLLVMVVGAPLVLLAWMGNPWPPGGWAEVELLTNRALYGAIAVIGWLAWAQMSACILLEAVAAIRGTAVGTVWFATTEQQHVARLLIASVAALGLGASTVASAPPAETAQPANQRASHDHLTSQLVDHDTPADHGGTVAVDRATTVWRIAETHLGDGGRWREVLDLNRGTTLADGSRFTQATQTIPPGTTLRLPAGLDQAPASAPQHTEPPTGSYTVKPGDTLWDISEKTLDDPTRYLEIYRASTDLPQPGGTRLNDPDHIEVGWKLTIPGATDDNSGADQQPHADEPGGDQATGEEAEDQGGSPTPPTHEPPGQPEAEPTAPAETAPPAEGEADQAPAIVAGVDARDSDEESVLGAPWVLAGLTGGGVLLAGSLFLGLQQRRRAQFRARRPGHGIATPDAELAPVEMTITAAGAKTAATVELMDAVLRRVAAAAHAASSPMPALAAVELGADRITLHLPSPAELPSPWQSTPDQAHWHCGTQVDLDDLGPTPGYVEPPYPLLVTIGESDDGSVWLLNCEELGILTLTGDADRGRDLARHLAAQLAVNPWSNAVEVDCIGIAAEAAGLDERIQYHAPGESGSAAIAEIVADAVAMVDRAAEHGTDVATGRTGQIDDDIWPSRMLLLDAAADDPAGLQQLVALLAEQRGRTATSILVTGQRDDVAGFPIQVTATGRVILEHAGLNLTAVGLTREETHGCALLYAQSEVLDDVPVPADESATKGWEAYADKAGALRPEHTVPRSTPAEEIGEPTGSLLDGPDEDYLRQAPAVPEDLDAVAPKVPSRVRSEVEESDPLLDADVEDWFSPTCDRPRLSLLGPVTARTHGKALTERKPYFTELLAFLALHRRHGVTRDEIRDAFGIDAGVARHYVKIVRDWLGTNPRTGEPHLPNADKAPATKLSGINVYQVDDGLLIDLDLFRRLRVRGQARGGDEGQRDLITALKLVTGRPFDHPRQSGWTWLAESDRHDHHMTIAIADVAFTVTTYYLERGDLQQARAAAELAVLAAPYEEATRLSLVRVTEAEGDLREAERILREEVCNRSDDGGAPTELSERTQAIIHNHDWLAG